MKNSWGAAVLALGFFCDARAQALELVEAVRDLNAMQNRMVMGDQRARSGVAGQLDLTEQTIAALEPEAWTQEQNVRAAAVYLLSGGAPTHLREIVDANFVREDLAPLLEASLRYAEGQELGATRLLDFDARNFPPMLGGHLALVQGGALIGADNARAVILLDLARLLMPASLVEEAALRREITALDSLHEGAKLGALVNRYVTKYLSSPYALNFWAEMRVIAVGQARRNDPGVQAAVEAAIDKAPREDRFDVYLALSRASLLDGRVDVAGEKLEKAERAAETAQERRRGAAYRAAITALRDEEAQGLPDGRELDELTQEDREMSKIVTGVLARLKKSATETPPPRASHERGSSANADSPIVNSVRAALERSAELLRRRAKQ